MNSTRDRSLIKSKVIANIHETLRSLFNIQISDASRFSDVFKYLHFSANFKI